MIKPNIASIDNDVKKLITSSKNGLDGLKKEDFVNPLDFTHDKAKFEGYLARMDEAIVLLGKSKEFEEFSLLLKMELNSQKIGYAEIRTKILDREESESDTTPADDLMHDRGLVNGRILALTHLGVLISTADNIAAKELAIKLGKNIPIGN